MAHRKLEHSVSLTPTEIANIESVIESSNLTEVSVEQNGERVVIGGTTPAQASNYQSPVIVSAPVTGTVCLGAISVGQHISEGDLLARLQVLGSETSISAPVSGRIAAIFVDDGGLAAYGTDLLLIEPEEAQ